MLPLSYPFRVQTGSSRRPIPTDFVHRRKYVAKDENFILLRSTEQLTNVNNQLDETLNLYVSNIIQRVIAQLIGQTDSGFATIRATPQGALNVAIAGVLTDTPPVLKAKIDFNTADTHDIIAAVTGKRHNITTLVFTVAGETNITLRDETSTFTGPMHFGGTNQPNGMVANHDLHPLKCTISEKFQIVSSAAIQLSGYVLYFDA